MNISRPSRVNSPANASANGFTIIELIVVLAIMAVLAVIVIANVTSYLAKGKDAAIKSNMSSLLTRSVGRFESTGSYAASASDAVCVSDLPAINSAIYKITGSAVNCFNSDRAWCAYSVMMSDGSKSYCVDSTGAKQTMATSSITACNSTSFTCGSSSSSGSGGCTSYSGSSACGSAGCAWTGSSCVTSITSCGQITDSSLCDGEYSVYTGGKNGLMCEWFDGYCFGY